MWYIVCELVKQFIKYNCLSCHVHTPLYAQYAH